MGSKRLNWDAVIGLAAIITAGIALVLGIQQTRLQQQTLAASTWPYVVLFSSDAYPDGRPRLALGVANEGVGPARVESITVAYDGKLYGDSVSLLQACCLHGKHADYIESTLRDGVIAANERIDYLTADRTPRNQAMWKELMAVRERALVTICYCSVLDECWVTTSASPPKPASNCHTAQSPQFSG